MNNKKMLSTSIITLMAVGCLIGCGGNKSSDESSASSNDISSQPVDSSIVGDLSSVAPSSVSSAASSSASSAASSTPASSESKPSSSTSTPASSSSQKPSSSSVNVPQDGTKEHPWLVSNKEDLNKYFGADSSLATPDAYFSLTNDIEYNDEWRTAYQDVAFAGNFNGNGHAIKGLRLTRGSTSKFYYGFLGNTENARFTNLKLEMAVEMTLTGKAKTYLVGAFGLAINTTFDNVSVSYSQFDLEFATNGDSTIYAGGLLAYWGAIREDNGPIYYYDMSNCTVEGNINVDAKESSDSSIITGGVVGVPYNSSSDPQAIFGINNCKFVGGIKGSSAVGGIAGVLTAYSSIVNCYVKADTIEGVYSSPSYVGGIVGQGSYFQNVMNCYANVGFINGTKGTSTYKSFAGDIYGYKASDIREYGYEGSADYNNYAKGAVIDVADVQTETENKQNYSADLLEKTLKFSTSVWDFSGAVPAIKANAALGDITVFVNANGGQGNFRNIRTTGGQLSNDLVNLSYSYKNYLQDRENFCATGLYYDQACKHEFKWYTPFNATSTLYVGWADLTPIIGTYSVVFTYYENTFQRGTIVISSKTFTWLMSDGAYSTYDFSYDGDFIYLEEYHNPLPETDEVEHSFGQAFGGYSDTVITITEDGKLEFYDAQTDDGVFTCTKTSSTLADIPTLKDSPILGNWYTDTGKDILWLEIVENNALVARYDEDGKNKVHYFGGVKVQGSKYSMMVGERGLTQDTYSYDATNDVMIGAKFVLTRERMNAVYSTSDFALRVVVTPTKTIIVKNGAIKAGEVTGTFANGQIVTIDGTKYSVSGKTLALYEEVSPIAGVYTGEAVRNSIKLNVTMDIKNNHTGEFTLGTNKMTFTWLFNSDTNKLAVHTVDDPTDTWDDDEDFEFTYIPEEEKFTGTLTQDFGSYEWAITVAIGGLEPEPEPEPEPEDTGILGTYSGRMATGRFSSGFAVSVVVTESTLTISWDSSVLTYSYTYNESTQKMTIRLTSQTGTGGSYDDDSFVLTYDNGTLTGEITQDFGDVIYTLTASKI